jgi:hypothetical protein
VQDEWKRDQKKALATAREWTLKYATAGGGSASK